MSIARCTDAHLEIATGKQRKNRVARAPSRRNRIALDSVITMAATMPPSGCLITTNVPTRESAFTDCAYVHSEDLSVLAETAGVDPESVKRRGMLCNVGEAVLFVK